MRQVLAASLFFFAASTTRAQEGRPKRPDEIPPRYGVAFRGKAYPQATPKETLQSALDAVEKGEFNYLAAHLLEPAFVDARVGDRAREAEPAVEANLAALRDFQQSNLDRIAREARVPIEPAKFRERVAADARSAAFRQLVRDVREKLTDDPEVIKDLRRFRTQGTFSDLAGGDTAKVGLAELKDRSLFFKKAADRWYLENRQTDERAPEPEKK
jgi:hypothetical protein